MILGCLTTSINPSLDELQVQACRRHQLQARLSALLPPQRSSPLAFRPMKRSYPDFCTPTHAPAYASAVLSAGNVIKAQTKIKPRPRSCYGGLFLSPPCHPARTSSIMRHHPRSPIAHWLSCPTQSATNSPVVLPSDADRASNGGRVYVRVIVDVHYTC